ncbi:MAG TPA: hypothetical protein VG368_05690 [Acidimicrobiales bacterium]|nr:hypothetical protein [Acidimicrobiales bacterium]
MLDISTAGTGVELFGTTPGEADERRIILSIELVGDVRNTVTTENSLRTGIEFDNVAGEAAAYITSIKNLGTRW